MIHYKEEGKWKDIDNTFIDNRNALVNNQNNFKVKFSKSGKNNLVTITQDKYEISWKIIDGEIKNPIVEDIDTKKIFSSIENQVSTIVNKDKNYQMLSQDELKNLMETLISNEGKKVLTKAQSSIKYAEIFKNIDLQYKVLGQSIKENIIIKSKTELPDLRFELETKNINVNIEQDNLIIFTDKNNSSNPVFKMEAPYMYDAKGAKSNNIKLNLHKYNDRYILELIPDVKWINSPDRIFPITVDPDIVSSAQTSLDLDLLKKTRFNSGAAYLTTDETGNNLEQSPIITIGRESSVSFNKKAFIYMPIPDLSTGDMLTSATLTLYPIANPSKPSKLVKFPEFSSSETVSFHLTLRNITSKWDRNTLSAPEYDTNIASYADGYFLGDDGLQVMSVRASTEKFNAYNQTPVDIDITNLAKGWYNNKSYYGFELETNGKLCSFTAPGSGSLYGEYPPTITLKYVNNSGLEYYWTYHSADIGRSGTGYVNDYTGNLVFVHNDLSMNGNRMPINVQHIYNVNTKENYGFGKGWRLNVYQTITPKNALGNSYYEYIDEDGTKHYFFNNDGVYKDAANPEIELTINIDNTYTISNNSGYELKFNVDGYLSNIIDKNGNNFDLNYNGNILTSITDSVGRTVNFDVNSNGNIIGITDPSNRRTSYGYSLDKLTSITYPDGKKTIYLYDSSDNLTDIINYDGQKLSYEYSSGYRTYVNKVKQSNTDGTVGGELNISYGNNKTTLTDAIGRKNTYQFNDNGNTTCILDGEGKAQYFKYNGATNTNALTLSSVLEKAITNYLLNHNIEEEEIWIANEGNYSGSGSCTFSTEDKYIGNQSLKIVEGNNQNNRYYTQKLNLIGGKTYTLSGYIKVNDVVPASLKLGGASLFISYKDEKGADKLVRTKYVIDNKNWDRYELSFTLPENTSPISVVAGASIQGATGTAYFDCLQLEEGSIANKYNLVENADFNYGDSLPNYWIEGSQNDSDNYLVSQANNHPNSLSSNCVIIYSNYKSNKSLYQNIKVNGKAGDNFVIGGWANGKPVSNPNASFALKLLIHNYDGTTETKHVPFNKDCDDWQYISDVISPDKDYSSIDIMLDYSRNENFVYFDGIHVYKENFGTLYKYDENENLTSVTNEMNQNTQFQYENNDLTSVVDENGSTSSAVYDNNHNILSITSGDNVISSFTYDNYGNLKTEKVGDSVLFIQTSKEYTSNGNYLKSETDSLGNTISYQYDETKGLLKSIKDSKNQTTFFEYEPNTDNLLTVSKSVDGINAKNSYSYENDRLKTINHNGFNYVFDYDSLGNNTSISIGNQNLITNTFDLKSGRITKTTYGNGQSISQTYNTNDQITKMMYNGKDISNYVYDASGNLGYKVDLVNDVSYRYLYDLSNNLIKTIDSFGNVTSYITNLRNSGISESIDGKRFDTNYNFDNDNKSKSILYNRNSLNNIVFQYDSLERLSSKTVNTSLGNFNTNLEYLPGINGSSSNLISSIINNGNKISYTYDKNCNIETITQNGKMIKYYYNELNELKREDNQVFKQNNNLLI